MKKILFIAVTALSAILVLVANSSDVSAIDSPNNVVSYAHKRDSFQAHSAGAFRAADVSSAPQCYDGACYYYAEMNQYTSNSTGAIATFSQAQPRVSQHDYHSLTELAIASPDNSESIELGWVVGSEIIDDAKPHLFVYHTVDSQPTCYNGCGFVQVSRAIKVGEALRVGEVGVFSIQYSGNRWYVLYNGSIVGYFPASLWRGKFTKVGQLQVYGEVSSSSATKPHSQMGNGELGTSPKSSAIRNATVLGGAPSGPFSYSVIGAPSVYKIANVNQACNAACGMTFGGSGY